MKLEVKNLFGTITAYRLGEHVVLMVPTGLTGKGDATHHVFRANKPGSSDYCYSEEDARKYVLHLLLVGNGAFCLDSVHSEIWLLPNEGKPGNVSLGHSVEAAVKELIKLKSPVTKRTPRGELSSTLSKRYELRAWNNTTNVPGGAASTISGAIRLAKADITTMLGGEGVYEVRDKGLNMLLVAEGKCHSGTDFKWQEWRADKEKAK
jgi:hypothetical protein